MCVREQLGLSSKLWHSLVPVVYRHPGKLTWVHFCSSQRIEFRLLRLSDYITEEFLSPPPGYREIAVYVVKEQSMCEDGTI